MFTGHKVRLRAYRTDDIPLAHGYINDPEVKRFLMPGVPFPIRLEEEEEYIGEISSGRDDYSFAIETVEGGRYIGGCGINQVDWRNRFCEVGIFIGDKRLWGKGYGTEAFGLLVSFAFREMNLNKVKLRVYDFNERGIRSYAKLGFIQECLLRQELFRDGRYYDIIIMGLLREEWAVNHQ